MIGEMAEADWDQALTLEVEQRLGVYKNIDLLVTSRFHSSIFTLKLNKCRTPIIVIEEINKWPAANSKCRDLFRRLGIEKFVIRPGVDPVSDVQIQSLRDQWTNHVSELAWAKLQSLARLERETLVFIKDLLNRQ